MKYKMDRKIKLLQMEEIIKITSDNLKKKIRDIGKVNFNYMNRHIKINNIDELLSKAEIYDESELEYDCKLCKKSGTYETKIFINWNEKKMKKSEKRIQLFLEV